MKNQKARKISKVRRIYVHRPIKVDMMRRIEIWRPVANLTPTMRRKTLQIMKIDGVDKALIDVDDKLLEIDLVVNAGLNAYCGQCFDSSGSRPAVFNYVAIGTDGTAPAAAQTALLAEVMRVSGTYAKDAGVGECSMDATFNITSSYALQECGLLNAAAVGTMACRDTYTTKNVVNGDTVKVYYTPKFQVP
jgi:hypothetical protein